MHGTHMVTTFSVEIYKDSVNAIDGIEFGHKVVVNKLIHGYVTTNELSCSNHAV